MEQSNDGVALMVLGGILILTGLTFFKVGKKGADTTTGWRDNYIPTAPENNNWPTGIFAIGLILVIAGGAYKFFLSL